jgi:hypothetical protein
MRWSSDFLAHAELPQGKDLGARRARRCAKWKQVFHFAARTKEEKFCPHNRAASNMFAEDSRTFLELFEKVFCEVDWMV